MKAGALTTIVTCVILLLLCAIIAPMLQHPNNKTSRVIEKFADSQVQEEAETFAGNAQLPNPAVLESRRQTLIEHMVRNLYFLGTYDGSTAMSKNDVKNLYDGVKDKLRVQLGSFDVLCQNLEVKNLVFEEKLKDSCDKFYIDMFAHREEYLYPGFDTETTDLISSATHRDNSMFSLDANTYQLTKNSYTPQHVQYTYDTNFNLIRANFYTDKGTTIPSYFVLACPFAIEYEQLGIFNVIFDVNSSFNIMNYYNTAEDNTQRALYLSPTVSMDEQKNKLNYLEMNYAPQNVASIIDTTPRFKQMRLFYADLLKQGVQTTDFHNMTIGLTPKSDGSFGANYSGSKTTFVNSVSVNFNKKVLSIMVDNTKYDEFLKEVNAALAKDDTTDFNLFVVLSMNTLHVYLMYKKNIYEHHLIATAMVMETHFRL